MSEANDDDFDDEVCQHFPQKPEIKGLSMI